MAKVSDLLAGLASVNGTLTLAVVAAGILAPFVKGLVLGFKKLRENPDGTVEYELVLRSGLGELDAAAENFQSVKDMVNAELERLGQSKLD